MMNYDFQTKYMSEPELIFGNDGKDKDPRIGLEQYGPYFYSDEGGPLESIRLGIISTQKCIDMMRNIINKIHDPVIGLTKNKWLYPNYPGINLDSPFKCDIKMSINWNGILTGHNIADITSIVNANERIAAGVQLYVDRVKEISENDDQPNVILCVIPETIEKYCGISKMTYGAKQVKPTPLEKKIFNLKKSGQSFWDDWGVVLNEEKPEKSYDFRNSLKGKVMEFGIPTQIFRQSTGKYFLSDDKPTKNTRQDKSSIAWNLSTALYYKANGKPWRLAKLRRDTCYVGVSFFRDKLHPDQDIQVSMAQVFTDTGEGLVLRGTEVDVDEHTKQPYLKKDQAAKLMSDTIKKYKAKTRRTPSRIVVHKTSIFSSMEQEGFNEAIYEDGDETLRDFVTIRKEPMGINFLRMGKYPVLRGTLIPLDENEFLLYSSGFSPRIRTYAGHKIPRPLKIIHIGDSSITEIAKEILGLTKLNWNTTSFSTSLPITVRFAHEVGKILSELPDEKIIQDHYKFFM